MQRLPQQAYSPLLRGNPRGEPPMIPALLCFLAAIALAWGAMLLVKRFDL